MGIAIMEVILFLVTGWPGDLFMAAAPFLIYFGMVAGPPFGVYVWRTLDANLGQRLTPLQEAILYQHRMRFLRPLLWRGLVLAGLAIKLALQSFVASVSVILKPIAGRFGWTLG